MTFIDVIRAELLVDKGTQTLESFVDITLAWA